jgi:hypothetical protein
MCSGIPEPHLPFEETSGPEGRTVSSPGFSFKSCGPGRYRSPKCLGLDADLFTPVPHPRSPAGRYQGIEHGQASAQSGGSRKATPRRVARNDPPLKADLQKIQVKAEKNAEVDIDLVVEVHPDGKTTDKAQTGKAETKPDVTGVRVLFPDRSVASSKPDVVASVDSPLVVKGTIKVQTVFGPGASPKDKSGYGRGTTKEDREAGNTSLGFHESRHRADIIAYLRDRPLPRFGGKVGMTMKEFDAAQKTFSRELQNYFDQIEVFSRQQTDEVGYKRSQYEKDGPR